MGRFLGEWKWRAVRPAKRLILRAARTPPALLPRCSGAAAPKAGRYPYSAPTSPLRIAYTVISELFVKPNFSSTRAR